MEINLSLIGFGEAGNSFATAGDWGKKAAVFDRLTEAPDRAEAMTARYLRVGVTPCSSLTDAVKPAKVIISLVTADQALCVAQAAAKIIQPGTRYFDGNSVAPDTKCAAAAAIENAGGHYVDMAIMSPVYPAKMTVPLLLSGADADVSAGILEQLGFVNVKISGDAVGQASAIKMIRSVMIKGMEALTAEAMTAAYQAGVLEEVLGSLGGDWAEKANYNIDRMLVHGARRSAEMQEVVKTLSALGVSAASSRATAEWQEKLGGLGLAIPPETLPAKLAALADIREENT